MENICSKCGGEMEAGIATSRGIVAEATCRNEPPLRFVILGMPTSREQSAVFLRATLFDFYHAKKRRGEEAKRFFGGLTITGILKGQRFQNISSLLRSFA